MNAGKILKEKAGSLITISPDANVAEAACKLHHHRIGALLVVDEAGKLQGIFTERDIVRALGNRQDSEKSGLCLNEPVGHYMITKIVTCTAEDSADKLMQLMTEGRFRHVPVLDAKEKLLGIISIGDVVKGRLDALEHETAAMRDYITRG